MEAAQRKKSERSAKLLDAVADECNSQVLHCNKEKGCASLRNYTSLVLQLDVLGQVFYHSQKGQILAGDHHQIFEQLSPDDDQVILH